MKEHSFPTSGVPSLSNGTPAPFSPVHRKQNDAAIAAIFFTLVVIALVIGGLFWYEGRGLSPLPGPGASQVTRDARAYQVVVPKTLRAIASDIRSGAIANTNDAVKALETARKVAAKDFGTSLDLAFKEYSDSSGAITDAKAVANVVDDVAAAMESAR